jgi:hypothetical protein
METSALANYGWRRRTSRSGGSIDGGRAMREALQAYVKRVGELAEHVRAIAAGESDSGGPAPEPFAG